MLRYLLPFFNRFLNSHSLSSHLKHFRCVSVHCWLLLYVITYALGGGLIFYELEYEASKSHWNEQIDKKNLCIVKILRKLKNYSDETVKHLERCWKADIDKTKEWNYITSTLYGFGIITTLGYNHVAPSTIAGRLFSIIYGVLGIPVTMIAITVSGRHLNTLIASWRRKLETFQVRNWNSEVNLENDKEREKEKNEETSSGYMTIIIIGSFLTYVLFGGLLLPLLNGKIDFINGLYYNFLCLAAIDFGQLIPERIALLPITFVYVCVGLALATIAIDDGTKYARKLQYFGQRIKNVAATKIWFGSKTLRVQEVLHAVGSKCGIEPSVIDEIDLDNLIEETIAQNEGKLPSPFIDEENPLSPSSTTIKSPSSIEELFKMNQFFAMEDTISTISSEVQAFDSQNDEKTVATEIIQYDEISEATNFVQIETMALLEIMNEPSKYVAVVETVNSIKDSKATTKEIKMLRKFKERKELYARDPQNLHKVYEKEWKRIENLITDRRQQTDSLSNWICI
ncbi:Ion channel family protein [Brugia pahangi]